MWETVKSVAIFEVKPAIGVDVVHENVLVDEFCWDVTQFDVDVLRSVQGCLKVEFFDVEGDKLGAPAGNDAVEDQLDGVEGGGLGPKLPGYLMFWPAMVMRVWLGSELLGRNVQTTLDNAIPLQRSVGMSS